ncbi:hypothetical protein F9L08_11420 [Brucella tritici]|nr:hypothetical protein F9L08_11420 [Brucella tritici]
MPYRFVFTHYPAHRSGIRNQSCGLISPRRRSAPLLEMLWPAHLIPPSWEERAQLHRRHSRVQYARHVPG